METLPEWIKILFTVGGAVAGAYYAVREELAVLRTKMIRAEADIQTLFSLHKDSQ